MKPHKDRQIVEFILVSLGAAAVLYGILFVADFLPEVPQETVNTPQEKVEEVEENAETSTEYTLAPHASEPVLLSIPKLNREIRVLNPNSSDIKTLDAALLEGVVRHPDSAYMAPVGTMFILGHSSYLPTVKNKNYQAFNDLQTLQKGDIIRVESETHEYTYEIERVYEAKASRAEVPIQFEEPRLILATCNSFGSKDDRHIVEAVLVSATLKGEGV